MNVFYSGHAHCIRFHILLRILVCIYPFSANSGRMLDFLIEFLFLVLDTLMIDYFM